MNNQLKQQNKLINPPKASDSVKLVCEGLEAVFPDTELIFVVKFLLKVALSELGHVLPKGYTVVCVGNLCKKMCWQSE